LPPGSFIYPAIDASAQFWDDRDRDVAIFQHDGLVRLRGRLPQLIKVETRVGIDIISRLGGLEGLGVSIGGQRDGRFVKSWRGWLYGGRRQGNGSGCGVG
jgi:hypothetical protein